jgi:hypothetical protein
MEILLQAAENQIDVLVTCDQNIVHQQNLSKTKIAIVVIDTNLWPIIKAIWRQSHGLWMPPLQVAIR